CIEGGRQGAVREECLFTRRGPEGEESLEYEAGVTRLDGGLTMIALRDISGEKRRRVLERCFLHDALNAAGGMQGMAELVVAGDGRFAGLLPRAAAALIEELHGHRALLAAESGDLVPELEPVDAAAMFDEVVALHGGNRLLRGWRVDLDAGGVSLVSDRVLLRRILGNLLRNALEACAPGSLVRMTARRAGDRVVFTVRNPGEIPAEVQQRIFRRSFSTKAARGRGIGTWSVKLLAERYLGGVASFACADGSTAFSVELPSA
ncbi:MAG: GHKL domain-containing protein, partial [Planctomycetes bacterium]|nr:GHKL domain-containing protein [Planctomycetota bacterium]